MIEPPDRLDGAVVLQVADVTDATTTGATRHFVNGDRVIEFAALALAQYADADDYYLFYCDSEWRVITDTLHDSVEQAVAQAEREFDGVKFSPVASA